MHIEQRRATCGLTQPGARPFSLDSRTADESHEAKAVLIPPDQLPCGTAHNMSMRNLAEAVLVVENSS
jgi:hypothetical protein